MLLAQDLDISPSLAHHEQHQVQVLVLEIPLFESPDTSSPILQYRRKGDILYVQENLSEGALWRPNYALVQYFEQESYDHYLRDLQKIELVDKKRGELSKANLEIVRYGFFTTLDHIGRVAYIPKIFVKPLYADGRELIDTVNRFDHDPMDYRKQEPLGPSYPFVENRDWLIHLQLGAGPAQRIYVDYGEELMSEDYSDRGWLQAGVAKKLEFDLDRRWSFGFLGIMSWQRGSFQIGENHEATETFRRTGLGPFMGYEAYRGKYLTAEINSGITVFPWFEIKSFENLADGTAIERTLEGWQVSPHIGTNFYFPPFLESQYLGFGMEVAYPITPVLKQTYSSIPTETEMSYRTKSTPEYSFLLAFRGQY